jgi:hypothetical protein
MKKSLFYLSEDGSFIGYTSGARWNGWFQPWLNRSEVERMARVECLECIFTWEGNDLFESDINEPSEEPIKVDSMLIDGVLHYQVGNGFCWDECKNINPYFDLTDSDLGWSIVQTQQAIDNMRADIVDGLPVDIELLEILKNNLKLMAVEQNYNRFLM